MARLASATLVGVLATLALACNRPDYAERFLSERPAAGEIEGRFVLEETTLERTPDAPPPRTPELRLLADGRFEARGFPLWRHADDGWELARFLDATGLWRVIPQRGVEGRSAWGVSLTAPIARVAVIGRHEERLQLIFTFGDPRGGDVMVFGRR